MEVSITEIINKTKQILINPKGFWVSKKEEESSSTVFTAFLFPIILIVATAVFIGELLRRSDFIIEIPLLNALQIIVLFLLQYTVSVFFTNELIKTFGGEKDKTISKNLVAYSMTPLLLIFTVTRLVPFLGILNIVGFYGFYIFWIGVDELLVIPDKRKSGYTLITILVNFFVFGFFSVILSKLIAAYY